MAGNQHIEQWTFDKAEKLFQACLKTAKDTESDNNDFIGEVAQKNDTDLTQLDYLKRKFPELSSVYKTIKSNCEANCFRNGKKNKIVPSLAIMNLKSNHGWTDRLDNTTKGDKLEAPQPTIVFKDFNE